MNIVIKISEATKKKMVDYYQYKKRDKTPPYAIFQADEADTIITLYESGKVMFQGVTADVDANMWREIDGQSLQNKENNSNNYYYANVVGSDEVGTGDYFGPIVVTATYVRKEDLAYLESLGIRDSKKMDDEKILKVAKEIVKKIKYRSILIDNKEYNATHSKEQNMNKIKAILHNKVLYQLIKEEKPTYDYIIVDEFAKENRYYDYLKGIPNVQRNITFLTKAEDKNLAVACASIISRYLFLKAFDQLSDELHIPLPKGASPLADNIGEEIVSKYGPDKLKEVAKLNFKNTERILKTIIM